MGFGDSPRPLNFNYKLEAQMSEILNPLKTQQIDRVIVVGHSLGGMVGTLLLGQSDVKIDALISLEGNLTLDDCGFSRIVSAMSETEFPAKYLEPIASLKTGKTKSEQIKAGWLVKTLPQAFYESSQSIVDWAKNGKLLSLFESSNVPGLLIKGKKSKYSTTPSGTRLKIDTIPNAGHFMLLDQPDLTVQAIHTFLQKL